MDYRRFLTAEPERLVLPYLGGPFVEAADRRLRLAAPVAPGYWLFEVTGRMARAVEESDPPDMSGLPAVRGYWTDGYLVGDGGAASRLSLPAAAPRFAPLVTRRWPGGALLFDVHDFESGVEDEVRTVYESRGTLADRSGVPAALRAAFGYAVAMRVGASLGVPVGPLELRPRLGELATGGEVAAGLVVSAIRDRRLGRFPDRDPDSDPIAAASVDARDDRRVVDPFAGWEPLSADRGESGAGRGGGRRTSRRRQADRDREPVEARVAAALDAAGAAFRDLCWLGTRRVEVRYGFLGERFVTIVEAETLRVVDAGICLDGTDDRLTLQSLPGVIAEAVRTGQLCVTAW